MLAGGGVQGGVPLCGQDEERGEEPGAAAG